MTFCPFWFWIMQIHLFWIILFVTFLSLSFLCLSRLLKNNNIFYAQNKHIRKCCKDKIYCENSVYMYSTEKKLDNLLTYSRFKLYSDRAKVVLWIISREENWQFVKRRCMAFRKGETSVTLNLRECKEKIKYDMEDVNRCNYVYAYCVLLYTKHAVRHAIHWSLEA